MSKWGNYTKEDYEKESRQRGKDVEDFSVELKRKLAERTEKTKQGFAEFKQKLHEK